MTVSNALIARPQLNRIERLTGSAWFWLLMVLIGFGLWCSEIFRYEKPVTPPVIGTVNTFEMTDQLGRPFSADELKNRLWLANTVSLADPEEAKASTVMMSNVMLRLRLMKELMRAVTFSADLNEAPEALRKFAESRAVNPGRWRFLTGRTAPFDTGHDIVLIDDRFQIRGRYPLTEQGATQLVHDVTKIVAIEVPSDQADLVRVQRTNTNK